MLQLLRLVIRPDVSPCLNAFIELAAFPFALFGPVENCAFSGAVSSRVRLCSMTPPPKTFSAHAHYKWSEPCL